MTNTDNRLITQATHSGRDLPMHTSIDYSQAMVRARIEALEAEADADRLASKGPRQDPGHGVRAVVGLALIRAGRAIAAEPHHGHPAAGRPSATT
jgi:hypothetical protein